MIIQNKKTNALNAHLIRSIPFFLNEIFILKNRFQSHLNLEKNLVLSCLVCDYTMFVKLLIFFLFLFYSLSLSLYSLFYLSN